MISSPLPLPMGGDADDLQTASRDSPVLRLISRGLEAWLRQQCSRIDALEIQLEGSVAELLQGRIAAVSMSARQVTFNDVEVARAELRSDTIQARVGNPLAGRALQLQEPFRLAGSVRFHPDALCRCLTTPPWKEIGDELSERLLGRAPLESLRIEGDALIITARDEGDVVRALPTRIRAIAGTLEIASVGGDPAARLPMDPAITIEEATIEAGHLVLRGEARVLP